MLLLLDLQKTFSHAILEQDLTQIEPNICSKKVDLSDAFQIYINNVNLGLCDLLAKYYPAIWSLLGDECAVGFALKYIRFAPPEIKNFEEWPKYLPHFLSEQAELKALPYLKDVGELEWLKVKSYTAQDVHPLSPSEITKIIESLEDDHIFITLDPSVFLTTLTYQAHSIIDTALKEDSEDFEIALGEYPYMISRKDAVMHIELIDIQKYIFLQMLQTESLTEAIERAELSESEQSQILSEMIQNHHIISIEIEKNEINHL